MATVARATSVVTIVVAILTADPALAQSKQREEPYCSERSARRLDAPPQNAATLREVAKRHPRNRYKFGPPPSQQDFPGSVWDLSNEFWYRSENGDLLLYVNCDDGYVYRWRFRSSGGKLRLLDHELQECITDQESQ